MTIMLISDCNRIDSNTKTLINGNSNDIHEILRTVNNELYTITNHNTNTKLTQKYYE